MTSSDRPARQRLGARLRELRATRFRSGSALAEHLGWVQSRVSKLETGAQLPSEADLDTWVAATDAGPEVRAELARCASWPGAGLTVSANKPFVIDRLSQIMRDCGPDHD